MLDRFVKALGGDGVGTGETFQIPEMSIAEFVKADLFLGAAGVLGIIRLSVTPYFFAQIAEAAALAHLTPS